MAEFGLSFDVLQELTENGLMQTECESFAPYGPLGLSIPGYPTSALEPTFKHQGARWALVPSKSEPKGSFLKIWGAAFTTVGRELLGIVDIEPMPEFTMRLKGHFAELH